MQVQILLLILWLLAILVQRVCDCVQGICLHLWLILQKHNEVSTGIDERCAGADENSVKDSREAESFAMSTEACWRHLVESPDEWWDNRATQKNPRAPDFKHKLTRRALWIDNWQSPEWVRASFEN